MPETALRLENLSKTFVTGPPWNRRSLQVLNKVDFSLGWGESLALIGANGAGKTTLLKIIAALVTADHGRVEIAGKPLDSSHTRSQFVGFASGEDRSLFFRLSGRQNLRFFGALHGLRGARLERRIEELSEIFDLAQFLDVRVDRCSTGMRARLGFARALIHSPALLLLDEPTKSLDPAHTESTRAWIRRWVQQGNSLVFATHLHEETEILGTRLGVLDQGSLQLSTPPARFVPQIPALNFGEKAVGAERSFASSMLSRAIAFFKRDCALELSYRSASILEVFGIAVSAAILLFLARMIDMSHSSLLGRHSNGGYFGFFVIGFAMSHYLYSSLTRFTEQIRQSQVSGNLEALFLSPARSWEVVAWGNLWTFVFNSVKIAVYLAVAMLLGLSLRNANWDSAILILLVSVPALAPVGILAAASILLLKKGDVVTAFMSSISTLLAGVYYPIQVLPWWLQGMAKAFPLTHAIQSFRLALLDGASPNALRRSILVLFLFGVVLGPPSMFAFSRAVIWSKRNGTLGQF